MVSTVFVVLGVNLGVIFEATTRVSEKHPNMNSKPIACVFFGTSGVFSKPKSPRGKNNTPLLS